MQKVEKLTPRGTHLTLEKTIECINSWYMGWSSYYSMTQYPSQLSVIEAHTRRRLRSRLVDQQKRRRYLFKKLVKRNVPRCLAAKTVFSNMGRWALSHTRAVERAYPNRWFIKEMGLKIRSLEGHPHWFDILQWVKVHEEPCTDPYARFCGQSEVSLYLLWPDQIKQPSSFF